MSRKINILKIDGTNREIIIPQDKIVSSDEIMKAIDMDNEAFFECHRSGQRRRYGDTTHEYTVHTKIPEDKIKELINKKFRCGTEWHSPHITSFSKVNTGYKFVITEAYTG